jgi:hypothetical protein
MKETFPIHKVPVHQPQDVEAPLPEIALQKQMKEGFESDFGSADTWYLSAIHGEEFTPERAAQMLLQQKREIPQLASAVLERTCNLHCPHCLYQDEHSSMSVSRNNHLDEVILNVVRQMDAPRTDEKNLLNNYKPQFMSAGRILRAPHLKLFEQLRAARPDVELGVIDNGTFVKHLKSWPAAFKFDWMDISIDGPEAIHNQQRDPNKPDSTAFSEAIEGLKQARSVVHGKSDGGRVTSLFTLSNVNASSIRETADMLLDPAGGEPLIDKFLITTLSPTNAINTKMLTSVDDFARAWEGIRAISDKYTSGKERKYSLSIYRTDDMEKLATVVGEKKFLEAFTGDAGLEIERNFLHATVDGVRVSYLPLSIWTPEEFLIEADGAYRTAYEGMFTLNELRSGISSDGRDTRSYTIEQLSPTSDFRAAYEHGVDHYWQYFGSKRMADELAVFQRIRAKAGK